MNRKNLSKRAELLHLSSVSLAEGMRNGTFRSLYRGTGVEFSGVREYLAGDDVRAIDWNVTARMGKPFVKMFDEEKELDVFLVADKSFSMDTGSGIQSRLEAAMECASLITLASLHNGSPVGAVTFDGRIDFSCPPKSGKNNAMMMLSHFEKGASDFSSRINGSALDSALSGACRLLKKRTLVIVISDFRVDGWQDSFARLAHHNDVVAIRITDSADEKLPQVGSVPFIDPETGAACILPTSSAKFARAWQENYEAKTEEWKKNCLRHGAVPLSISTTKDPAGELIKFFTARERY